MFDKLIRFFATGLGLGYLPLAPGTFGTVLGSVIFYAMRSVSDSHYIWFVGWFSLFSIVVSHLAEKSFKQKDCQKIVIDEVAGVLVCYAFIDYSVSFLVLGFILFRVFDIAKLFPADFVQKKFKGGLGVVADDLVAGVQGGVLLWLYPHFVAGTQVILSQLPF